VHSAANERRVEHRLEPVAQVPVELPATEPPVEIPSREPAAPVTREPAEGFTLEFASGDAMQSLLDAGRVRLYAAVGDNFWLLDRAGDFVPTDPPEAYYRMADDTVPPELRRLLPVPGEATWGVTLPERTIGQLRGFMQRHDNGRLLIQAGGDVSRE
jgi:hypothetical protein